MKIVFTHESRTVRSIEVDVPDGEDADQFFYENYGEGDGEIVGGGWQITEREERA